MTTLKYTPNELLAATLSRTLNNGESGFIGVGSSGRAFNLVVGIPLVASRLAQELHAPDFSIQIGPLISPEINPIPPRWNDFSAYDLPAAAFIEATDNLARLATGGIDVAFITGSQIDRFGNINITKTKAKHGTERPLVGSLALPELQAFAGRTIILADLSTRTFVENVDFVTGMGHLHNGRNRSEVGLHGMGPALVLTDKAVFDFNGPDNAMRLASVHDWVTVDEVYENMSFIPDRADSGQATQPPTETELRLIREVIDPDQQLLGN